MSCSENSSLGRRAIGGYFELELRHGGHYHEGALRLNTARNCFEYVLLARKYRKVYIPYYTCDVMLQPLTRHSIEYEFYKIDEKLEPVLLPVLNDGEAFLYTNYFGLKQRHVKYLSEIYGSKLIVDNSQAFYAPRIDGIDTFYSPRKFVGVPDGGYLYTDCMLAMEFPYDKSYSRFSHLLLRIDESAEAGYGFFQQDEDILNDNKILRMSRLTSALLSGLDYEKIRIKRIENYNTLNSYLGNTNFLSFELSPEDVPMCYPYYAGQNQCKREELISNRIYISMYWPNVKEWCSADSFEYTLMSKTLFLPIDQRYDGADMLKIKNYIL